MSIGKITTVCGEISPDRLGAVDMHDHTFYNMLHNQQRMVNQLGLSPSERLPVSIENMQFVRNNVWLYEELFSFDDKDFLKVELDYFKHCGGGTIVDVSTSDIRRSVDKMRDVSQETEVNIVCSTGMYHWGNRYEPYLSMSEDEMYRFFMQEITQGIDNSGIRPGMVKGALEIPGRDGHCHPEELKSLRACARAAADSGLPLTIHTATSITTPDLLDALQMLIQDIGIKPERIVVSHIDVAMSLTNLIEYANERVSREPVFDRAEAILELGMNIGVDTCNNILMQDDLWFKSDDMDRLREIMHLVKRGYEDQIVLGQDIFPRALGIQAGSTGYARILTYIKPQLELVGCDKTVIDKLFYHNPARILSH